MKTVSSTHSFCRKDEGIGGREEERTFIRHIGTTLPSLKAQLAFRGSRPVCLYACTCMFYKWFDLT